MQKVVIIVGGVVLLLVGALLGVLLGGRLFPSQTTTNNTATTNSGAVAKAGAYCQQYLQDEGNRLNASASAVDQAQKQAFADILAQMVKDGKLTQKEATEISASASPHETCAALDVISGKSVTLYDLKPYLTSVGDQVASGLHTNRTQLVAQLRAGKSLSSIAMAQGVSATQLQTIEMNAIQNELNKAVSAGDLTSQQGQTILQKWQRNPQLLDALLKRYA